MTIAAARQAVRALIQDGLSGAATPVPYNVVRLEDLSDEIPAVATPTQTTFLARFEQVPTEAYLTVFAIPGTLTAYVDGSALPTSPTADVNANGNFTLPVAPVSQLLVSYGWQYFADSDIDSFTDGARAWLAGATIDALADGLTPALVQYAAANALRALARKATLANLKAGDASADFTKLSETWDKQAEELLKQALASRDSYYSGAGARSQPSGSTTALGIDLDYQPAT